jgi:hypothetical protein
MTYIIKVTHTAPTFKQFEEWGIQQAYPIFFMEIIFYDEKDNETFSNTPFTTISGQDYSFEQTEIFIYKSRPDFNNATKQNVIRY